MILNNIGGVLKLIINNSYLIKLLNLLMIIDNIILVLLLIIVINYLIKI